MLALWAWWVKLHCAWVTAFLWLLFPREQFWFRDNLSSSWALNSKIINWECQLSHEQGIRSFNRNFLIQMLCWSHALLSAALSLFCTVEWAVFIEPPKFSALAVLLLHLPEVVCVFLWREVTAAQSNNSEQPWSLSVFFTSLQEINS